jgi:hypothetical protein
MLKQARWRWRALVWGVPDVFERCRPKHPNTRLRKRDGDAAKHASRILATLATAGSCLWMRPFHFITCDSVGHGARRAVGPSRSSDARCERGTSLPGGLNQRATQLHWTRFSDPRAPLARRTRVLLQVDRRSRGDRRSPCRSFAIDRRARGRSARQRSHSQTAVKNLEHVVVTHAPKSKSIITQPPETLGSPPFQCVTTSAAPLSQE